MAKIFGYSTPEVNAGVYSTGSPGYTMPGGLGASTQLSALQGGFGLPSYMEDYLKSKLGIQSKLDQEKLAAAELARKGSAFQLEQLEKEAGRGREAVRPTREENIPVYTLSNKWGSGIETSYGAPGSGPGWAAAGYLTPAQFAARMASMPKNATLEGDAFSQEGPSSTSHYVKRRES